MPVSEKANALETPRAAYTILKFCEAFDISERMYFKMRDAGWVPREMRIGRTVRISLKAAADWAAAREQQTPRKKATATETATAGS